jgi:pimeloyl-ACP methyl ester carboxylesterase
MATLLHNGVQLAYDEMGVGDPAFVFVHGWTCDRSFFALQAEHFAGQHRVLSLDLRGHGESDKPRSEYSIATDAADIAFVIAQLGLRRVVAVGHSSGGMAVLQLAVAHPDHVAAIVMVDPAPFALPPEFRTSFETMVAAIEAGNQEPRRRFITDHLFLPTSDQRLMERIRNVMLATPSHVAAAAMRGLLAFDARSVAANCKVPALHVATAVPLNPLHLMSQWLPGVVNGMTVGAGHFNQLEVPEQVNGMISSFVRHYVSNVAAVGVS